MDCERNFRALFQLAKVKDKTEIQAKLSEMRKHALQCKDCAVTLKKIDELLKPKKEQAVLPDIKVWLEKFKEKVQEVLIPFPSFQYHVLAIKDATGAKREIITLVKTEKEGFKVLVTAEKIKDDYDLRVSLYKKGTALDKIEVIISKENNILCSKRTNRNGTVVFGGVPRDRITSLEKDGSVKLVFPPEV